MMHSVGVVVSIDHFTSAYSERQSARLSAGGCCIVAESPSQPTLLSAVEA